MIKIAIIVAQYSENVIRQLRGFQLAKFNNVNFDIIHGDEIENLEDFSYDSNFSKKQSLVFLLFNVPRIIRLCRKKKYNIIMNLSGMGYSVPITSLCGMITRTPFILMYSGDHRQLMKINHRALRVPTNYFLRKIQEFCYKKSRNMITLGARGKRLLSNLGIQKDKIFVIPCFIDTEKFHQNYNKNECKKKIVSNINKKIILYIGRLTYSKGCGELVKIINLVNKKSKNTYLFYIIGEGTYSKQLVALDNTVLIGRVNPKIINRYYYASDLLILPSHTEGLPNVILEALSCGLPVVATPVGEIPNLISKTCNKPEEFTAYILSNKWRLDDININNKESAKKYNKIFTEIQKKTK